MKRQIVYNGPQLYDLDIKHRGKGMTKQNVFDIKEYKDKKEIDDSLLIDFLRKEIEIDESHLHELAYIKNM